MHSIGILYVIVPWKGCVNSGHTKTESLISSRWSHKKQQGITQRFFDIALRAAQNDIKNLTTLEEKKRTIENGANRQAVSSYVNHSVILLQRHSDRSGGIFFVFSLAAWETSDMQWSKASGAFTYRANRQALLSCMLWYLVIDCIGVKCYFSGGKFELIK